MKPIPLILCALVFTAYAVAPGLAEDPTKEDIVCALNPKCGKAHPRSMPRGVAVTGGSQQEPARSIDLYVNFAFDSAELTSDARITLDRLGAALRDQRLDGFTFMIAGHTDAKGSAEYNQKLSERRAEAVRQYLIAQFGVVPARLTAKGYGKQQLLDPSRPEDGVNRRVQVVNTTASSAR
jgi:outer membrane protein OmpA-like peptidoglycan-associated protein